MTALSAAFDDIIIFTGYTLEELRAMNSPAVDAALSLCSVLVDGPYVKALNDGRGMRGSSNQRIHIFRNEDRYCGLFNAERQLQNVLYDGRLLTVGIP